MEIQRKLNFETFKNKFDESWHRVIKEIIESEEVFNIYKILKETNKQRNKILPTSEYTFRAFKECNYNDLKLIIIGQDPYCGEIKGIPQADGICMSSKFTNKIQPSLESFYDGIYQELYGESENIKIKKTPDLSYLSNQGILLTNYSLTVELNKIGSHSNKNLWLPFWKLLIENVFNKYNSGLIYVFLGKEAEKLEQYILPFNNYVFKVKHPSFYARIHEPWNSNGIFSKINTLLKQNNNFEMKWFDEDLPF